MSYNVQIRQQPRKSLAMKVTPGGVQVLIPQGLAVDSPEVQTFIEGGLRQLALPEPVPAAERLSKEDVLALVENWAGRLGVEVKRVQLRAMRNKWGSISTAGTLTLARDLLDMPRHLVEYVICHELLHLTIPTHNRVFHLLLSRHIPDWCERERVLGRWVLMRRIGAYVLPEEDEAFEAIAFQHLD
jgi:predicted metal-dependent hydrolase